MVRMIGNGRDGCLLLLLGALFPWCLVAHSWLTCPLSLDSAAVRPGSISGVSMYFVDGQVYSTTHCLNPFVGNQARANDGD